MRISAMREGETTNTHIFTDTSCIETLAGHFICHQHKQKLHSPPA
jgi:hypothetical protein